MDTGARSTPDRRLWRDGRYWWLLAVPPLASGAALIVYVVGRVSLGLALLSTGAIAIAAGVLAWWRLPHPLRLEVARRARVGLLVGLLATAAYDGTRWLTVTVFHDTFSPFDVFPIFGRAIAGDQLAGATALMIGITYHVTNGLLFAVAYAILFAGGAWWVGIFWGLGLEALMLTIYPGWLHPHPFAEFASDSMLGHVAYGSVLGLASQRGLKRQGWPSRRGGGQRITPREAGAAGLGARLGGRLISSFSRGWGWFTARSTSPYRFWDRSAATVITAPRIAEVSADEVASRPESPRTPGPESDSRLNLPLNLPLR